MLYYGVLCFMWFTVLVTYLIMILGINCAYNSGETS